uniref:DUF1758 domain-containing protein n=2 Tax=Loa loa TaxID=7209 RepID=A0A1I7VWE4_LOALO
MSSNIIASIQPAKERLVNLLLEINSVELKSPEPDATIEQQEILYTMRNRTLEDKLRRIQLCIKTLQSLSDDWLKYTRTITSMKKKEEEKAFEVITVGETGIYQILQQGNEAIITLIMDKEDVEQKLIQLSKEKRKDVEVSNPPLTPVAEIARIQQPFPYRGKSFFTITPPPPHPWDSWDFGYGGGNRVAVLHSRLCCWRAFIIADKKESATTPNVHLPQLSLPTFHGDPRQWRQFWSSFNAAVHSQPIPEIQKLNYLYSCLNGNALEVELGYGIAPENYEIVRRLLREKYGDPSAATTILYKELRSIKRDEKEWVKMVEHIEKVIRQLEALGENMEHSSIEHWIEDKLPEWILDKVFEQKELDVTWSVSKLRNFLLKRVNRSEKVKNCQKPNTQADSKLTTTKFVQKQRYSPVGTSALSTIQSPQKVSQPTIKRRRPCVFCTRDHWDSECGVYSTVKARTNRLKILKKCLTCLKDSHTGEGCKVKKRCFYCKGSHNSALCDKKWLPSPTNTAYSGKKEQEIKEHSKTKECSTSTLTTRTSATTETLLLCREITVFNPLQPQRQQNALALFDIGSQLSFITKKLSHQLRLFESDQQVMKIVPFGTENPNQCLTTLCVTECANARKRNSTAECKCGRNIDKGTTGC